MRRPQSIATLLFLALAVSVSGAEPTLDLNAIIQGLNDHDPLKTNAEWLVRYTNTRVRLHPPPGTLVEWPDAEVVNARRGDWLLARISQPALGREETFEQRLLWRDGSLTTRIGDSTLTGTDRTSLASYFWYPNSLLQVSSVRLLGVPEEALAADPELSTFLPFCLTANRTAYTVRANLEEVDGAPCHVVERPGRDVLWIDAAHGFQVRQRTFYQESGAVQVEFRASDLRERAPGVWLPGRQVGVMFNLDSDPPEFRGRIRCIVTNTLSEARFESLPESLFAKE